MNTADDCAYVYGVNDGTWRQDPFSDVESDEDSEIEMLECAEDAEMDEDEDDDDDDEDDEAGAAGGKRTQQVWIPGKGGEQPEHLEVDNSTHEATSCPATAGPRDRALTRDLQRFTTRLASRTANGCGPAKNPAITSS